MTADPTAHEKNEKTSGGLGRRTFLAYLVASTTVAAAADLGRGWGQPASAVVPSAPQIPEVYDLNDLLTDAARATANLITVVINEDGTASFALPRAEVGQGITTSTAMLIAEELDLPLSKIDVTLADARPELLFNQLTGGSNTTISTFTPIRVAAAAARGALLRAASIQLGDAIDKLTVVDGVVTGPSGSLSYAELAKLGASSTTKGVQVALKDASEFTVIGTARNRKDARDIVTGKKQFAMDLDIPGALPTMVSRPPTLNGTPVSVRNRSDVLGMPGVTDVAQVDTGVAVRAETFGQCIDAIRALDVEWKDGPVKGQSDKDILAELRKVQLPLAPVLPTFKSVDTEFVFYFRSNSSLEPNCAIADVRSGSAEIWGSFKSPITAQERIAVMLGMTVDKVKVHVTQGGGSFGRKLFYDAGLEAAAISQAMGKPVKLMWHRADEPRQGRGHPMAISRVRAQYVGKEITTLEQRHTSVETDFRHGLGELISAYAAELPPGALGNLGYAQTVWNLTQEVPFNFGVVDQVINETDSRFNTGSMRNIYSPDSRVAVELTMDKLAKAMGMDRLDFRLKFVKDARTRAVIQKVAKEGQWGRALPAGMAQGIAIHKEYKGVTAALVEIDCRPATVSRFIQKEAVTGPRVTRVTFAVDAGLVINPRGLEAQMMGGVNDGIALALTSSCHLEDGRFLEASWDNYFYTRQWNTPPRVDVHIMPSEGREPGGAGEAGVAATFAAVASAYGAATGSIPTYFPINHRDPLPFTPKPFVPSAPASPTDGLDKTR